MEGEKMRQLIFLAIFTPALFPTAMKDSAEVFQSKSQLKPVLFPEVRS